MSHEMLVKPLGLMTRPNIYGEYPVGALSTALNCVMRSPGVLENAPQIVSVSSTAGNIDDVFAELFPLTSTKVVKWMRSAANVWGVYVDSSACTFPSGFSTTSLFSATGRIANVRARDRVFSQSNQGDLALDSENPSLPAPLRDSGIAQPHVFLISTVVGTVYTATTQVAGYAIVIRRVFSDGYEIQSVPSPIVRFQGSVNSNAVINYSLPTGVVAGDLVEIYRTPRADAAVSTTDPGPSLFLVKTIVYDGSSLVLGFTATDTQLFGPLGETTGKALYTNPGAEGALASNRIPNLAKCSAMYKDYRFLGNITERPQFTVRAYGGWGITVLPGDPNEIALRSTGVGRRNFSGTTSIGSGNVTGISATQMLGLVPGQIFLSANFPTSATILTVGVASITVNVNATVASTITHDAYDVIVVNGVSYLAVFQQPAPDSVFTTTPLELTCDSCIGFSDPKMLGGITTIIEPNRFSVGGGTTITAKATNGALYNPPLPDVALSPKTFTSNVIKNGINWSKNSQPEHFPSVNEDQVGNGEIIAFESTRDATWIFCTDGLFRLSGAGGVWRVDIVDTTCILAAPRASCVLREVVYAYTNGGLVRITDAGVEPLSEPIVGDLLPGAEYTETPDIVLECNETDDEIVIRVDTNKVFVYSVRSNAYTTFDAATAGALNVTAMAYARYPSGGGNPSLLFARTLLGGTRPTYWLWNSTVLYAPPTAVFQAVFAQDPFSPKQWIDGTYIFAPPNGKSIIPSWNGVAAPAVATKGSGAQFNNEARVLFGVPRRAAIGNTIVPGYSQSANSTTPTKLFALSLRFRAFGEQHLHR